MKQLTEILSMVLNPKGKPEVEETIQHVLLFYNDPKRRWQNADYLSLGIHEHLRLLGVYPTRDTMAAWLYHAAEVNDEETGAVAFLRDSQKLGFTFDEAENYVIPLIVQSRPSRTSSSVVGDMRIAILGQSRVKYLAYSRKLQQSWKFLGPNQWEQGRIAALKELLSRPRLYFREEFESKMAGIAKENMQAELSLLGYVPPPPKEPEPVEVPFPMVVPIRILSMEEIIKKQEEAKAAMGVTGPTGPAGPPQPGE